MAPTSKAIRCSSHGVSGQRIAHDFKALLIEPVHDTIRMPNSKLVGHIKSLAVDGPDNRDSFTQIARREKNSDLNGGSVNTFAVLQCERFRRFRLYQTGENHEGND
jgi:hypothetical protein